MSSLQTIEDARQALAAVLAAVASGEIAPAEAARIARRVVPSCARSQRPRVSGGARFGESRS